jgi:hypothetical protein
MAKGKVGAQSRKAVAARGSSGALKIARSGINTAQDFANVMGALMTDLISGAVAPQVGNAMCNAGGKLLKAVELQVKYGAPSKDVPGKKVLHLTSQSEHQETVQ